MPIFHFDLVDGVTARDATGHECVDGTEARMHGDFIAQRIGTEQPAVANRGNYISVRDSAGDEIYRAPIKSTVKQVISSTAI